MANFLNDLTLLAYEYQIQMYRRSSQCKQELLYMKEKPICNDGHGCNCENLHLVSCNGTTIIAIGCTRGNKKALAN